MKGVLLAGGNGTRLLPLTKYMNKHLLPVGKHPMIAYGIHKLHQAGIDDILLITGSKSVGLYAEYLENGRSFGVNLTYKVQEQAGGIAEALELAKGFIPHGEKFVVLLGDNLFQDDLKPFIQHYVQQPSGTAMVLLSPTDSPHRYGVPVFAEDGSGKLLFIEEKPVNPRSRHAVTGIYMYDHSVFDIISRISPSERGELEITDVNNLYAANGTLIYDILQQWWCDAGTFESLQEAAVHMKDELP
ncbi:sugar phosphate nucleotidyltransferase [Virgibacillus sp. LDC1]|uniref:sugar phosphate nucleotidyltransferase n=1 Tax=Paenibacillus TaxID=44249 RepID=UPI002DB6A164|nr:sugar phosphate nucleotidyltransferase [Paenibacillus lautus]MCV4234890.1 sugar phosphate nucleotidyltransferase [Virgibacillus sp. LDC1]MEC0309780.1 sugar phosphate nucleotidyltransferase [Paenibacillus lautus]